MSAYRFSLAAVLRIRRAEYEKAALVFVQANEELRRLIARRDAQSARCRDLVAATGSVAVEDFLGQRASAGQAAAVLLDLNERVNIAAAEAALSRIAWNAAHQRVAALERLDERRREEWRGEQARLERVELDEYATAAFTRELQHAGAPQ